MARPTALCKVRLKRIARSTLQRASERSSPTFLFLVARNALPTPQYREKSDNSTDCCNERRAHLASNKVREILADIPRPPPSLPPSNPAGANARFALCLPASPACPPIPPPFLPHQKSSPTSRQTAPPPPPPPLCAHAFFPSFPPTPYYHLPTHTATHHTPFIPSPPRRSLRYRLSFPPASGTPLPPSSLF